MSLLQIPMYHFPPLGNPYVQHLPFPSFPAGHFLLQIFTMVIQFMEIQLPTPAFIKHFLHQADNTMPYFFDSLPIKPLPSSRAPAG